MEQVMPDCTIALTPEGRFAVHIPGAGAGHTVQLPCNLAGLEALRTMLQERQRAPAAKIGTPGAPIQYLIDQWLKDAPKRLPEELEELELDLEGL